MVICDAKNGKIFPTNEILYLMLKNSLAVNDIFCAEFTHVAQTAEVCDQRLRDWTHFEFRGGRLQVSWASSVIAGPGPSMESCGENLWLPGTS